MDVNVLTSGYWPTYPAVDANLPPELGEGQQVRVLCVLGPDLLRQLCRCPRAAHSAGGWELFFFFG